MIVLVTPWCYANWDNVKKFAESLTGDIRRADACLNCRYCRIFRMYTAPAGCVVPAAPEGGALACPSALNPTSSWWALVTV
jgi:hypothetical protein